ncbi:MAG: hypothetical protein EXR71_09765 [Myxococcales bacterium]|nr:hypothetical protein [Myxococcales bacterium]
MRRAWPFFLLAAILWLWPVPWTLWTDEFFGAGLAERQFSGMLHGVAKDRHPPLFFLVTWSLALVDTGDNWLRLVSGLSMLGALVLTTDAARRHVSDRVSVVVAAWFAASAVPALFSHTLRPYAMATLASSAMLWGALEASVDDDVRSRRGRWVLAAAGIAAFWTHYAAALVGVAAFAAAGASLILPGGARRRALPLAGAGVAVVAGCLPWLLGPFPAQFAEKTPKGAMVWEVLTYLFWSPDKSVPPLSFAAFALGIGGGLWLAMRRGAGSRAMHILAATYLVAMVALPFWASQNVPARLLRNYVGFFPVAAIFAGVAIEALLAPFRRFTTWVPVAVALALTGPLTARLLTEPFHPQDLNAGHDYRVEAQVLDAVIPADARIRFQPPYVVEQFARYAPGLRERVASRDADWALLTSGGAGDGCLILHAFRIRLSPPKQYCETTLSAMAAQADLTGYPWLFLERAVRHLDAGELDEASADMARVFATRQRWPGPYVLAARLAEAQKDDAGVVAAYTEALRLARAFEPPGTLTAGLWRALGRLRERAGDGTGAAKAAAAAECAAGREPVWACGGPMAWATRPAEGLDAAKKAVAADDAPSAEPAAAGVDPGPVAQAVPVPVAPLPNLPVATPSEVTAPARKRKPKPAPSPAVTPTPTAPTAHSWSFADGVPPGWVVEGAVASGGGGVVIGDGAGRVSSLCSPPLGGAGPVSGTVTRAVDIGEAAETTFSRIEGRPLGPDRRALPGVKAKVLTSRKTDTPMGATSIAWTPPPEASSWRLCLKTGGAALGTTTVTAIDLK